MSAWFDTPSVVRQFPWLFRAYAAYCRITMNRRTGMIRGGSFLLRKIARVTRALGASSQIPVDVDHRVVFINLLDPRMLWVLDEIRAENSEAAALSRVLKSGDTFVDIGANHGSYSLIASTIVGPTGRIIAFEPQPVLAELLRRSLGRTARCAWEVHEVACSDRAGSAEFFIPASNSGAASLFPSFVGTAKHLRLVVRTGTVDSVLDGCQLPGRVMIKLDVEGSELAALRGCERLIEDHAPAILFELNPISASAASYCVTDVLNFLNERGYPRFLELDDLDATGCSASEVDTARARNLLAMHQASSSFEPRSAPQITGKSVPSLVTQTDRR
jgi:FkbM family methyltransferase